MLWWTLRQLKSSDPNARAKAARELGAAREKKAAPELINALQDDNSEVRTAVIDALGKIAHPASAEPLVSALVRVPKNAGQGKEAEYELLSKALAAIGGDAVKPLIRILASEDQEPRRWAAYILGLIKDPQSLDALIQRLDDSRSEVRKTAALALGDIGDVQALDPLTRALGNRDLETRRAAAEALGNLRAESAVPALTKLLSDSSEPVQLAAIGALSRIGGLDAARGLRSILPAPRKVIAEAVESALKRMTFSPADAGQRAELAIIRGDFSAAVQEGGAAVPALISALGFKDPQMRVKAAEALGSLRSPDSVQNLIQTLRDHDIGVQNSAAMALFKIGEPARKALETCLSHYDTSVIRLASGALGEICDPRSASVLAELITANETISAEYPDLFDAVQTAVKSLGRILSQAASDLRREDLEMIAGLPDGISLLGPSSRKAVCTDLRDSAAAELHSRKA